MARRLSRPPQSFRFNLMFNRTYVFSSNIYLSAVKYLSAIKARKFKKRNAARASRRELPVFSPPPPFAERVFGKKQGGEFGVYSVFVNFCGAFMPRRGQSSGGRPLRKTPRDPAPEGLQSAAPAYTAVSRTLLISRGRTRTAPEAFAKSGGIR